MIMSLKKQFSMQWKDWIFGYLIILFMGVMGWVIMYFMTSRDPEVTSYAGLGGLMAAIGLLFYTIVSAVGQMWTGFNLAVSMNSTRKHFLASYYLVIFPATLVGLALVGLIGWVEESFYRSIYPGLSSAMDFQHYLVRYGILAAAVLVLVLGFCGALLLRYGRKAFWIMWAAWMITFLGIPRILDAVEDAPGSVFGIIGNKMILLLRGMSDTAWIALGIVLGVICLAGTYGILRRQQVNV